MNIKYNGERIKVPKGISELRGNFSFKFINHNYTEVKCISFHTVHWPNQLTFYLEEKQSEIRFTQIIRSGDFSKVVIKDMV